MWLSVALILAILRRVPAEGDARTEETDTMPNIISVRILSMNVSSDDSLSAVLLVNSTQPFGEVNVTLNAKEVEQESPPAIVRDKRHLGKGKMMGQMGQMAQMGQNMWSMVEGLMGGWTGGGCGGGNPCGGGGGGGGYGGKKGGGGGYAMNTGGGGGNCGGGYCGGGGYPMNMGGGGGNCGGGHCGGGGGYPMNMGGGGGNSGYTTVLYCKKG